MNISITTAIKAGFFGAIGFFVAQIVIVPVVLLLFVLFGVSLAGIVGLATSEHVNRPTPTATRTQAQSQAPQRWVTPTASVAQR